MSRAFAALFVLWSALAAAAQTQPSQPPVSAEPGGVTPQEIQRLFDAYTIMQAQDSLELTDEQYSPFLTRMRTLQEVRRRHQQDRGRVLQDLRKLTQQSAGDDAQLNERLKALRDIDTRAEEEVRKAYDAIDAVLTPRQQARFRVFEEQMERRKIELLTRARASNRANTRKQ